MTKQDQIKLFEERKVRTVWDEESEKWYFSIVDVVEVLTDSVNPTDYLKKIRRRDPELHSYLGTNCPQISMVTSTGKKRKTLAADTEQLFRLIQSIPSPKAEPFKLWMARVASERLDQMQDPELSIDQAMTERYRERSKHKKLSHPSELVECDFFSLCFIFASVVIVGFVFIG